MYLQVSWLNQVVHSLQTTGTPPFIISAIHDICHDVLGDICVSLHQLHMDARLPSWPWPFCLLKPRSPANAPFCFWRTLHYTLHDPVSPSEAIFFNQAEADFSLTQGSMALLHSYPKYHNTCHHLGHVRMNSPVYQCPFCLHWSPGHTQACCPLCCHPALKASSSFASFASRHSSFPEQSCPVPPPKTGRCPCCQTVCITPYSNPGWGYGHHTPYCNCGGSTIIPGWSNKESDGAAEANLIGSPGGKYRDY